MNGSSLAAILWKQATGLARQLLARGCAALGKLLTQVPRSRLILWGACVLLLAAWWFEHQAHLRQAIELEQFQKQTATTVSTLQARATVAIREANERNGQEVQELKAKRRKLEGEATDLAARLQSFEASERAQAAQVAALPPAELARRVANELATQDSGPAEKEENRNSETRRSQVVDGILGPPPPTTYPLPPTSSFSEPQLRNLATALVERDACREQKGVVEAQFANCRAQVDTNAAIIQQHVDSLAKLNQALSAQDEILARREAEQQAELKAARGSRLSRLARAVEWVALGIVVGVVIR
jgi:hypothetical protein